MVRVIINSDDFGYSPAVNKATVAAFKAGLITSTTMLANFEEGFADAEQVIRNKLIDTRAIGIHLNLTDGNPLTEGIKNCERFCDGNKFHARARQANLFKLSVAEKNAVQQELNAQIERIKSLGFIPSHIDSHHHVHTEWAVMDIIRDIAPVHGIRKVRLSRNVGPGIRIVKRVYKYLFNKRISMSGFNSTRLMGDINDYLSVGSGLSADAEVMVHAILKNDELVDLDGKKLDEKLAMLPLNHAKLINYTEL